MTLAGAGIAARFMMFTSNGPAVRADCPDGGPNEFTP
jgi:hypothetical protein